MRAESEKLLKVLVEAENLKEAGIWQLLSEPIMRAGAIEDKEGQCFWLYCVVLKLFHRKSNKHIDFIVNEMHPDFEQFLDLVPGTKFKFEFQEKPLYNSKLSPHISAHLMLRTFNT